MKLSTEQFYDAMCDPAFQRVNLHQGKLRGEILETDEPPEEVPTFMSSKIDMIRENLAIVDSKIAIAERERSLAAKCKRGAIICFCIWVASWLVLLLSRVF